MVLTAQGRGRREVDKAWHMAGEASRLAGSEGQLGRVREGSWEKVAPSSGLSDKQLPGVGSPGKGQAEGFTGWFHLKLMSLFIIVYYS